MKNIRLLSLAALLAASTTAGAASFSYDYVEGSFGELDNKGLDGDAFYFGLSHAMDKQWGLLADFGIADFDGGVDGKTLRGGAFFNTSLNKDADLYANGRLVYVDADAPGGSDDDIGLQVGAGIRYAVQDNFHLEGELGFYDVDPGFVEDGIGLKVAARYYIDKQLSANLGIASDLDYDGLFIGVRYNLK